MTPVSPEVSRPLAVVLGARPEQVRRGFGEPDRGVRRDGPIAREKPLHARGVSSTCVGRLNRHRYTLVRGRSRCDRTTPAMFLGGYLHGTGQRVQHRLDRRRTGERVGGGGGLPDRAPEDPVRALQRLPGARGRAGCRAPSPRWKLQATKSRGARRQGQRRRGRAHRHREGRELVDDHQLDRRARRARIVGHRQDVVAGRRRHRGLLREDVRAARAAQDPGRGAGRISRSEVESG